MKVFVDLRGQMTYDGDDETPFTFYCTVSNTFEIINGSQVWYSMADFAADMHLGGRMEHWRRFRGLIPDWVK